MVFSALPCGERGEGERQAAGGSPLTPTLSPEGRGSKRGRSPRVKGRSATRDDLDGGAYGLRLPLANTRSLGSLPEDEEQRAGNVDGAVCADDHADDHYEGEQMHPFAAEDVQHHHHQEYREGCQQRPAQGLIDAIVDRLRRQLRILPRTSRIRSKTTMVSLTE